MKISFLGMQKGIGITHLKIQNQNQSLEKGYQEEQKWEDKKKSDKENQKGRGPKNLTLDQKLRRLPITLAQLKAGNSSEKLKK